MSLTTFIEGNKDVRSFLRDTFPKPRTDRPQQLIAPPRTRNYSLVGTAFDYLCRWQLEILSPRAKSAETWVAEEAIDLLSSQSGVIARRLTQRARRAYEDAIATGVIRSTHAKSALQLARLDVVFRSGLGQEEVGRPVDRNDVRDLIQLLTVLRRSTLAARRARYLNPTFAVGEIVGGADADLISGDALVEIKVTKDPKIWRSYFNQLLGYYLLFRSGGFFGLRSQPRIQRLGVYLARFGHLALWRLEDIASDRVFAKAAKDFIGRARLEQAARRLFLRADAAQPALVADRSVSAAQPRGISYSPGSRGCAARPGS
jgi:hypothetical protein